MGNKNSSHNDKAQNSGVDPKVTGIGGIFFFVEDTEQTKTWYAENLGIETDAWGATFKSRDMDNPDKITYVQWSPFKKESKYFAPSKKNFMINYRVQNIEGLVAKLKENGVTVLDPITTYAYGKFVHIMDNEGNKIELWEPADQVVEK